MKFISIFLLRDSEKKKKKRKFFRLKKLKLATVPILETIPLKAKGWSKGTKGT